MERDYLGDLGVNTLSLLRKNYVDWIKPSQDRALWWLVRSTKKKKTLDSTQGD